MQDWERHKLLLGRFLVGDRGGPPIRDSTEPGLEQSSPLDIKDKVEELLVLYGIRVLWVYGSHLSVCHKEPARSNWLDLDH